MNALIAAGSAESIPDGNRNEGNSLTDKGKKSMASVMSKESAVSLPDEIKIADDLNKLAESEDEDDLFLNAIEKA